MEQLLKIAIKNTEAAGVEVVPTEDGVEIIVTRREKDVAPRKAEKSNLEILKAFCTEMKNKKGTDHAELKSFWEWYSPKAEDWKGTIFPDRLWARWIKD